jgi:hypothetical protein
MVAVDHEGGRVQRFITGFSRLPPMRALGRLYDREPALAVNLAGAIGIVLAAELRERGVDFSFAPVLDIDFGSSSVIGDRAFHATAAGVAALAGGLVAGLARMGMGAVGKHFPGHGYVRADSHHEVPIDARPLAAIEKDDLAPYRALIGKGLAGVMPGTSSIPSGRTSGRILAGVAEGYLARPMGFDGSCSATTSRWKAPAWRAGSSNAAARRFRRLRHGARVQRAGRRPSASSTDSDRTRSMPAAARMRTGAADDAAYARPRAVDAAKGEGCSPDGATARSMYAPSSVLTRIFSPLSRRRDLHVIPVSRWAGLNDVVAVAPLMFGSVDHRQDHARGQLTPIGDRCGVDLHVGVGQQMPVCPSSSSADSVNCSYVPLSMKT